MAAKEYTNQLIHEKSPYLLQHAHNPVNWFPWGEAAFQKAKEENKPDYKARIEEQQQQLNALSMRNRELEISLKEAHSKQKTTMIALIVASLIAIAAVIGWVS